MKKNMKGFALVETLIVSAFVVGIFTLLYVNMVPMMGEYEKRENYDGIDNTYNSYLIKRLIENSYNGSCENNPLIYETTYNGDNATYKCSPSFERDDTYCSDLMEKLGVDKVYFTKYKDFSITNSNDSSLDEYLKTISISNKNSECNCRIIVKYKVVVDDEEKKDDDKKIKDKIKYQFSTIGVKIS